MQNKNQLLDVHEFVTDSIIKKLEQGIIPWKHPYINAGFPQNLITKKFYRGINLWLLSSLNYPVNQFLTLKQLKDIGGTVKKNETAHPIIFWKWTEVKDEDTGQSTKVSFSRLMYVFNIHQCNDIPDEKMPFIEDRALPPIVECEELLGGMPQKPEIRHKGKIEMYNPCEDIISMCLMKSYDKMETYYSNLFHYLIRSTGHPKRLNRREFLITEPFVSDPYSIEALVTEIGSSYLKFYVGLSMVDSNTNSTYIEGWLEKLKKDKRMIIYASTLAQKATDFILNVKFGDASAEQAPAEEMSEVL